MIVSHSTLNTDIDIEYINSIADREGYDRYLPITFVKHLMCAFSFYMVGKSPYDCIQEDNDYTKEFAKILSMIRFDEIKTHNPVIFAIKILHIVHRKINLRKLEVSSSIGSMFAIQEDDKFENYKSDITSLTSQQIVALNLPDDTIKESSNDFANSITLSEDIVKLLKFYDGLHILQQPVETKYDVIKHTIMSFSDFYKIHKYRLVLPSFKADLGMKNLDITKVESVDMYTSEVIIAIDFSMSMAYNVNAKNFIRSILLYYIGQLEKIQNITVNIIIVVGKIKSIYKITKIKDLINLFNNLPEFILPVFPADTIFNDLNVLYPGKSIIFLSDGTMKLKNIIKLTYKLYSIVLVQNNLLKQTSLLSGGQFIILQ